MAEKGKSNENKELDTDDASVIKAFDNWRITQGLQPRKRKNSRKKKIHTVSISEDAWMGLVFLAGQHGIRYYGVANVSGLLEDIGMYRLLLINKQGESKLPEIGPDGKVTNFFGPE